MMRDSLSIFPEYEAVLAAPLEDEPRRRLAAQAAADFPVRARVIELQLDATAAETAALVKRSMDERVDEVRREALEQGKHDVPKWVLDRGSALLGFRRGFVESVETQGERAVDECLEAWDRFPLLHLSLRDVPLARLPGAVRSRMRTLVSLQASPVDDAGLIELIETGALDSLRKLSVHGPMTVASLQALCERPLPRLEDLAFRSPQVPNPCEVLFSDNWATVTGHREVELSPFGDELEARYGFKRFLHAASRLSIYPCSDGALDRLPLLDEDIVVRRRLSLGQPHRPLLPPR